jgi:hypothetical protein
MIEHELTHIKEYDVEHKIFLSFTSNEEDRSFNNAKPGYKKFLIMHEKRANRIPIGCTECPYTIQSIWQFNVITVPNRACNDMEQMINDAIESFKIYITIAIKSLNEEKVDIQLLREFLREQIAWHYNHSNEHTSYPKRIMWIHKIAWLKAIEAKEQGRLEDYEYLASRLPQQFPCYKSLVC